MERASLESDEDGNPIRKKTAPGINVEVVEVLMREVMEGPEISIVHRSALGIIRSNDAKRSTEKNMMTNNGIILIAMEEKTLA